MPKLALLDGHSLAYRAFYALPADLATSAGQVTNAVFGFTSMLIKLLGDEKPDALAVAWDVRGPTFRKEQFPEYKAQRDAPPDLFASQLPLIDEVLDSLQITQIRVPGFEADDVIATLATRAEAAGWDVLVVTGDRDAFQLVDDSINVLYTLRGISDTVRADRAWITSKYGIPPDLYLEYASLRGDKSDNLPGVPGVGEKTAAKLIAGYGSLESVYEHLGDQTPRLRENLEANRDQVFLNRELMRLVRTVALAADGGEEPALGDLTLQDWDHDTVRTVFDGLAFRTLWDRLVELGGATPVEVETFDVDVRTATTAAGMPPGPLLAVEVVRDAGGIAGVMVAAADETVFVPIAHLAALAEALGRDRAIVAHDAKPLVRLFLENGIDPPRIGFDTALASYLINPAQRTPDLEELAYRELGLALAAGTDEGAPAPQGAFDFSAETAGPDLESYARRAVAAARLVPPLEEQIDNRGGGELFRDIELPPITVLAQMEETGVGVDRRSLQELRDELLARLAVLETAIHEAAGGPFNVNSTLQLREVLYERLALPVLKRTPKGVPSTDATVLGKLRDEHPVVASLLQYRELEKLRSTYVDALIPLIEEDGRVRGRFNQMAAATGRLSQEQPNLQNIPVRSEEGRTIRRAFVADESCSLLVADYSQIELRILAHLSADAGLVEAFESDLDIHSMTAARVAGVDVADVGVEARRRAKMINFGLLYGMEAFGLAQRLDIPREEAEQHIEAYFDQFPDVREFMAGIVTEARTNGYTTTLLGRRRYLPELSSSNFRDRQSGERMALNAPIQGTAADIIKKAMVVLDAELREATYGAEMLLQIHDELVLEVPDSELEAVTALTVSVMEGIVALKVPLRVETATGRTLADCEH
jgi:DNA polymerase-1